MTSATPLTSGSPVLRVNNNGETRSRASTERERKRKRRRERDGKENVSLGSEAISPVAVKDISQISGITAPSFREQPSTANLSGNFHSTFNYPLHSTLNYPLSSTFRMDSPGEGLEVTVCSETDTTRTPQSQAPRSSTTRRVRSMVNQAVRHHLMAAESEVDCDCDSSVLTDLSDDDLSQGGQIPPPSHRVLKRQTGQAALTTCSLRAPVALSRSDFLVLDDTLQPHFDVTLPNDANDSLNATCGSLPDLQSVAMTTPKRRFRISRQNDENQPPRRKTSSSRRRVAPCGRDSEPDSGVSCSSRRSCDPGRSALKVLDKPSRYCTESTDKKVIAKRLKRFNTPKHSGGGMKIKTLGVF